MQSSLLSIVRKLVFISPFLFAAYFFQFQVAGIPFTVLELFVYVLFGLWIVELIRDRKIISWDKRTRLYWYAAFGILVGATIGVLSAPDFISLPSGEILNAKRATLGVWKGWLVAPMLYFAVITQVIRSESQATKLLRMFVYSAGFVSLLAHGWAIFADGLTIDFRLSGFYESANYLALYVVPALLLNLYFVMQRPKKPTRQYLFDLGNLTVLTYSLFFTQSYAAIIAVFGAMGLYAVYQLFSNPKRRRKMLIALTALAVVFSVVIVTQFNTPKFKQALDYKNRSSTSVRLEIYQTAIEIIRRHPLTGVGPGLFQANYQNIAPVVLNRAPLEWNMPHSHNIFLGFWINAGIIGLIAFLALLILAHQRFTVPLIALWGTVIHGLFDMPFWKNDLAMIFWLLIACILILQKHANHSTQVKKG